MNCKLLIKSAKQLIYYYLYQWVTSEAHNIYTVLLFSVKWWGKFVRRPTRTMIVRYAPMHNHQVDGPFSQSQHNKRLQARASTEQVALNTLISQITTLELRYQAKRIALAKAEKAEYSALLAKLKEECQRLHYIYTYVHVSPKRAKALAADSHYYELQCDKGKAFVEEKEKSPAVQSNSQSAFATVAAALSPTSIREWTAKVNWFRLFFLIRLKRAFQAFSKLDNVTQHYKSFADALGKAGPALNYIGWMFYVPRFLANVGLLIKHTADFGWMNEEERQLGFSRRLKKELEKRWVELANDAVWMTVGIINCFVLTGTAAMGLTAALYFFDVVVAIGQSMHKIRQHDKAIAEVDREIATLGKGAMFVGNDNHDRYLTLKSERDALEAMKSHEYRAVARRVIVAACLFAFMVMLAVPHVAIAVTITAAIGTLVVCLAQKYFEHKHKKDAPKAFSTSDKASFFVDKGEKDKIEVPPTYEQATKGLSRPAVYRKGSDTAFFSNSEPPAYTEKPPKVLFAS